MLNNDIPQLHITHISTIVILSPKNLQNEFISEHKNQPIVLYVLDYLAHTVFKTVFCLLICAESQKCKINLVFVRAKKMVLRIRGSNRPR